MQSLKDESILGASAADRSRFWSKVEKTASCWTWVGSTQKGYGLFWVAGQTVRAHRAAKIWCDEEIKRNLLCCHRCNNPACVRPSHIYWGTHKTNGHDRVVHGVHQMRVRRGSQCVRATLTEDKVVAIRDEYAAGGISYTELAKKFNVTSGAVSSAVSGKNWQHCRRELCSANPAKGYKRGELAARAKLSAENIRQIRKMRAEGALYAEIAPRFGVGITNISAICTRKTWAHLE